MTDLTEQLREAVTRGELEPWKAALLGEWLQRGEATEAGPSPEGLARLLVDEAVLTRLKASGEGPWDALVAQARSLLAHGHVGQALDALTPE